MKKTRKIAGRRRNGRLQPLNMGLNPWQLYLRKRKIERRKGPEQVQQREVARAQRPKLNMALLRQFWGRSSEED